MRIRILGMLMFTLLIFACKNEPSLPKFSLVKYGLPIDIKAPANSVVESSDLTFLKDVTVKSGDNYFVQIFYVENTPDTESELLSVARAEVESSEFFSKMIQEDEHGFIFEKKIGDRVNYDFRHIKVYGNNSYAFQTGMMGTFTEEDVRTMYNSVK